MNGFTLYQQATHHNESGSLFKFVNGRLLQFKITSIGYRWVFSDEKGQLHVLGQ